MANPRPTPKPGNLGPQTSLTRCTFPVLYPVLAPERGPEWQTHARRRNLGRVLRNCFKNGASCWVSGVFAGYAPIFETVSYEIMARNSSEKNLNSGKIAATLGRAGQIIQRKSIDQQEQTQTIEETIFEPRRTRRRRTQET